MRTETLQRYNFTIVRTKRYWKRYDIKRFNCSSLERETSCSQTSSTQIDLTFEFTNTIRNEWPDSERNPNRTIRISTIAYAKRSMREWLNSFRLFADSTPRVMERQMIPCAVWKTTACLLRDSLRRACRGETLSASLYYASLVFQRVHVMSVFGCDRAHGNENARCIR